MTKMSKENCDEPDVLERCLIVKEEFSDMSRILRENHEKLFITMMEMLERVDERYKEIIALWTSVKEKMDEFSSIATPQFVKALEAALSKTEQTKDT